MPRRSVLGAVCSDASRPPCARCSRPDWPCRSSRRRSSPFRGPRCSNSSSTVNPASRSRWLPASNRRRSTSRVTRSTRSSPSPAAARLRSRRSSRRCSPRTRRSCRSGPIARRSPCRSPSSSDSRAARVSPSCRTPRSPRSRRRRSSHPSPPGAWIGSMRSISLFRTRSLGSGRRARRPSASIMGLNSCCITCSSFQGG